MAITFISAGTEGAAGSGTTVTPGSPAGATTTGDVWIMAVSCAANLTPTAHADWTHIATWNVGVSTVTAWWFRYSGAAPTNNVITTASSTANRTAGIAAFRGCLASGAPIQTHDVANDEGSGSTTAGFTEDLITQYLNTVAVQIVAIADDVSFSSIPFGYTAAFEDTGGGTQSTFLDATGSPDSAIGLFYKTVLLPANIGQAGWFISSAAQWTVMGIVLIPEPTHKIIGVTRDNAGSALGSVTCYLLKFDSGNLYQVSSQTSDASTGAYDFRIAESAGTYAVAFRKTGAPNKFDITDFNITPAAI